MYSEKKHAYLAPEITIEEVTVEEGIATSGENSSMEQIDIANDDWHWGD